MVAVATAGRSTAEVGADGVCTRTKSEQIPMLMQLPSLSSYPSKLLEVLQALPDGWRDRSTIPPAYAAPEDDPTGVTRGFLWRLSGASHEAAMIGLGDIVLPALALAYGRRVDLCHPSGTPPACGYFLWAVIGYGVGLLVTQAANVYGWTFNDVQGQPALLYLVPGVVGSQFIRAVLCGELPAIWEGTRLPQPPENLSNVMCDGCRRGLFLDEKVYTDGANVDYSAKCYAGLPPEQQARLKEMMVYERCGVPPPPVRDTTLL